MPILGLCLNHRTTAYVDLMVKTLLDVDRSSELQLVVLDNNAEDLHQLDWAVERGVTFRSSGYGNQPTATTHGEILRSLILSRPILTPSSSSLQTASSL